MITKENFIHSLNIILLVAVLYSIVTLIQKRHQKRLLTRDLQQKILQQDELNAEWSQLLIEQGTYARHGEIENTARKKLHMTIPLIDKTTLVLQQ